MRIRLKALIPLLGVVGAWLASPQALALVPDEWSHVLIAVSSLVAVLTPALLTNRPKTPPKRIPPKKPRHVGEPLLPVRDDGADAEPIPPMAKIPAKEKGDA